jgi:hypothetical protein
VSPRDQPLDAAVPRRGGDDGGEAYSFGRKFGRDPFTGVCKVCGRGTTDKKPFCLVHVERHDYARETLSRTQALEEEVEEVERGGDPLPRGPLLVEARLLLRAERLLTERAIRAPLGLSSMAAVQRVTRALERLGEVVRSQEGSSWWVLWRGR